MATKQGSKDKQNAASAKEDKQQDAPKNEKANSKAANSKDKSAKDDSHEDMNEGKELDTLLAMLEEDDITAVEIETANEIIDKWYDVLHKSDEPELKQIGDALKQLKKQLSASKPKEEQIIEILGQLGEQVDTYADNAPRGSKTKLHKLGKALNNASVELEEEMAAGDEDVEDEDMEDEE